jgi:antitoxin ParD1/3/4
MVMELTSLNISFVEAQVRRGSYSTPSEYIRALVREDERQKARERLEAQILEGLRSPASERETQDWAELKRRVLARTPRGPR